MTQQRLYNAYRKKVVTFERKHGGVLSTESQRVLNRYASEWSKSKCQGPGKDW